MIKVNSNFSCWKWGMEERNACKISEVSGECIHDLIMDTLIFFGYK